MRKGGVVRSVRVVQRYEQQMNIGASITIEANVLVSKSNALTKRRRAKTSSTTKNEMQTGQSDDVRIPQTVGDRMQDGSEENYAATATSFAASGAATEANDTGNLPFGCASEPLGSGLISSYRKINTLIMTIYLTTVRTLTG